MSFDNTALFPKCIIRLMENAIGTFLADLSKEVKTLGVETGNLTIDHIAYSTTTPDEYERQRSEFLKHFILIREPVIGKRRVAVFKFLKPLLFNGQPIKALELIEPKGGEKPLSGWEHAEFLVDDFDTMIEKYPEINWITKDKDRKEYARIKIELSGKREIKFLKVPILDEV